MRKVQLRVRKGTNPAGTEVEYDDTTAEWLVMNGYADPVESTRAQPTETADSEAPAPRRGRPPKARVKEAD